ncbi:MAG TPA: hypothetical protein VE990_11610 [Acidimicrobiales bacterium]|nr:hypothetical protein [Acidimicrobiales bacterium]
MNLGEGGPESGDPTPGLQLDLTDLAGELCDLIAKGACDPRIAWSPDRTEVRVIIDAALAHAGGVDHQRRAELSDALEREAVERGWAERFGTRTFVVG